MKTFHICGIIATIILLSGLSYAQVYTAQSNGILDLDEVIDIRCAPASINLNDHEILTGIEDDLPTLSCNITTNSSIYIGDIQTDNPINIVFRDQDSAQNALIVEDPTCFTNNNIITCAGGLDYINSPSDMKSNAYFPGIQLLTDTVQEERFYHTDGTNSINVGTSSINPEEFFTAWYGDPQYTNNFVAGFKSQTAIDAVSFDGKLCVVYNERATILDASDKIFTSCTTRSSAENAQWTTPSWSGEASEAVTIAPSTAVLGSTIYQTHVGLSGKIWTRSSADAVTWSGWTRDQNDPFEFTDKPVYMTNFDDKLFQVHVGGSGKIWTRSSEDGTSWSAWSRDVNDPFEFTDIPVTISAFQDEIYQVHVGGSGKIWTRSSEDGETWSSWERDLENIEEFATSQVNMVNSSVDLQVHLGLDGRIYTRLNNGIRFGNPWFDWQRYDTDPAFSADTTSDVPVAITIHDGYVWQFRKANNATGDILFRSEPGESFFPIGAETR